MKRLLTAVAFACCAYAQSGGQGMLGVGRYSGRVQVFAGIYECNMTSDQTPATLVNVDCVDNAGAHTKQTLTISGTPQTFSITAPPKHACDSTWHNAGKVVGKIRRYSDTLLIFLMKGAMPEKYRERYEHSGTGGGALEIIVTKVGNKKAAE